MAVLAATGLLAATAAQGQNPVRLAGTARFDISASANKAAFVGNLELARTCSDGYGRPIHVGEFVDPAPPPRCEAGADASFFSSRSEASEPNVGCR